MTDQPHERDPLSQLQFDAFGRFVDLDEMEIERYPAPPPIRWVPADDLPHIQGLRVATNSRRGPQYNMRAATDVITDDEGRWVNIVAEWRWYVWHQTPEAQRPPVVPRAICWPSNMVWAEVYDQQ